MIRYVLAVILSAGMTSWSGAGSAAPSPRNQGDAAYDRADYPTAARWYLDAARAGDATAQVRLGWLYRNGTGVPRDLGQALHWFAEAARQGHSGGQFSLGTMYEHGYAIERDEALAARWYRAAADQGNAGAQNNLAWLYQNGRGLAQDFVEAARWYRRAADQGQRDALGNLGLLYLDGRGVTRDRAEGERLLRRAAAQGDRDAAAVLARLAAETTGDAAMRQSGARDTTIYGRWRSIQAIRDEGLRRMYLVLEIRPGTVTFRTDCRFLDGGILTSQFESRAEISATTIRIFDGGGSRANDAENQCIASIQPTALPFHLTDSGLALTFGGKVVMMSRENPG